MRFAAVPVVVDAIDEIRHQGDDLLDPLLEHHGGAFPDFTPQHEMKTAVFVFGKGCSSCSFMALSMMTSFGIVHGCPAGVKQGDHHGQADHARDDTQRHANGDFIKVRDKHLGADKHQDCRQPVVKVMKQVHDAREREASYRRPRMAKTFEVYTINGSSVIARMAGIESTAKIRSVVSTANRTTKSGVAHRRPSLLTKNRPS